VLLPSALLVGSEKSPLLDGGEASLTGSLGSSIKGTLPKKSAPLSAYDNVLEFEDVRLLLLVPWKVEAGRRIWSSAVAVSGVSKQAQ
jgi:hypothetical protein